MSDGKINAVSECDDGWISGLDYSQPGTVSFKAEENGQYEKREGSITVEYSAPDATPVSFSVVIIQEGREEPEEKVVFNADVFEGDYI